MFVFNLPPPPPHLFPHPPAPYFHLLPANSNGFNVTRFIVCVFLSLSCNVTLRDAFTQQEISDGNFAIAQLFPSYDKVTLSNTCILTCRQQNNGHGGILALRAKTMNIDGTSKIVTTGKGMLGKSSRFHGINMSQSSLGQLVSPSVGQPVIQSVRQSDSQSVVRSVGRSLCQSISQLFIHCPIH